MATIGMRLLNDFGLNSIPFSRNVFWLLDLSSVLCNKNILSKDYFFKQKPLFSRGVHYKWYKNRKSYCHKRHICHNISFLSTWICKSLQNDKERKSNISAKRKLTFMTMLLEYLNVQHSVWHISLKLIQKFVTKTFI